MDAITGAEPKQCDGAPVAEGGAYFYRSAPPWAGAAPPGRGPVARLRPVAADCCSPHSSLTALPPPPPPPLLPRSLTAPPRYTSGSRGRAGACGVRVQLRCWSTRSRGQTEKSQSLPVRFDPHSLCPSSLCPLPTSASSACSLPLLALLSRAAWAEAALHFTPPRRTASPAPPRARHRTGRIARISTASPPSQSPPRSCAAALVLRHGCGAARFVADARLDRSSFAVPFGTKTILPRQVRGLWSRSGKVFSVQIRTRSTSR